MKPDEFGNTTPGTTIRNTTHLSIADCMMNPAHPNWPEFCRRHQALLTREGCPHRDMKTGDVVTFSTSLACTVLAEMGLTETAILASIKEFNMSCAECDCELVATMTYNYEYQLIEGASEARN